MSDRPLHTADNAAMHHDRPVFGTVGADEVQVELLGLVEVDLDGGQGELASLAVLNLNVDLGAIERGFTSGGFVRKARTIQDVGQYFGGSLPHVWPVDVLAARARE